jgi:hypothetical protein
VPTRVWYSAYGRLTAANVANNERIRSGVRDDDSRIDDERWLHAL